MVEANVNPDFNTGLIQGGSPAENQNAYLDEEPHELKMNRLLLELERFAERLQWPKYFPTQRWNNPKLVALLPNGIVTKL